MAYCVFYGPLTVCKLGAVNTHVNGFFLVLPLP